MSKRVLLVEDHADIRAMMAMYLELNKYEVIEAADGYEAIEKALKYKPDIILMDIAMPVLDGLESVRAMRRNAALANTPIFCLTAYGDFYKDRAKAAGYDEVMQKPIDFGKLDNLLERHMH